MVSFSFLRKGWICFPTCKRMCTWPRRQRRSCKNPRIGLRFGAKPKERSKHRKLEVWCSFVHPSRPEHFRASPGLHSGTTARRPPPSDNYIGNIPLTFTGFGGFVGPLGALGLYGQRANGFMFPETARRENRACTAPRNRDCSPGWRPARAHFGAAWWRPGPAGPSWASGSWHYRRCIRCLPIL